MPDPVDFYGLPELGDRLFQHVNPPARRERQGSWLAYARSYKASADRLVQYADPNGSDADVYPILFLYRHYVELEMKSIAALTCVVQSANKGDNLAFQRLQPLLKTHNLTDLRPAFHSACFVVGFISERFLESLNAFDSCVEELNTIDPGSYAFRYPIDRKLTPQLSQFTNVDLNHLKTIIDKFAVLFAAIRDRLQRHLDWWVDNELFKFLGGDDYDIWGSVDDE